MNNQISVIVKRYLIAAVIAVLGLVMIIVGIQTNQDNLFNIAAVNLFVGGILVLLFSAGILSRSVVFVIGAVCIAITVFIGYRSWVSVQSTIRHMAARERSEKLVRFNLTQIRDIERAHRNKYGIYAGTWDKLINFFENDKIQVIESQGAVPSRPITPAERDALYGDKRAIDKTMTEREAALLAAMGNPDNKADLQNFRRDTVMVPYKDEFLGSISRIKERNQLGLGAFDIEKLQFIPMTDPKERWTIETRDSFAYLGDTIPTIHVYGKEPIPQYEGGKRKIVGFGNLQTNSDKATWE
ncbi:MAG: hypothetical protein R3277_11005 [Brumimicrobium sp.]|nr:hypothetical protein [Brumimicrobium sp.]